MGIPITYNITYNIKYNSSTISILQIKKLEEYLILYTSNITKTR